MLTDLKNLWKPIRDNITCIVIPPLFILSVNMLQINIGFYGPEFMEVLSILLLIFIFICVFDLRTIKRLDKRRLIYSMLFLVLFTVIFPFTKITLKLFSLFLFVFSLLLLTEDKNLRKVLGIMIIFSFIYAVFVSITRGLTMIWLLLRNSSYFLTDGISSLIGKHLIWGPSISGFWFLISLIMLYAVFLVFSNSNKKRAMIFLLSAIFIWILYILIQSLIQPNIQVTGIIGRVNLVYLMIIPELILLSVYVALSLNSIRLPSVNLKGYRLAAFAICLVLSIVLLTFPYSQYEKGNIVIYREHMLGDWNKPVYGVYGNKSTGMFGLLPEYLSALKFSVNFVDGDIDEGDLKYADILVIINMNKTLSSEEKKIVWNFVREGGSLLVMGDHTDIAGMMGPLNDLLRPVGISFRFDDTLSFRRGWEDCIDLLDHPATLNVDPNMMSWSVGASLDIEPSKGSYPVIIGKFGYSDHGNYSNPIAFLGNYMYDSDEELGDIILAASAFYGKGKVFVCGDTTSFQNTILPLSYEFVNSLFSWLSGNQDFSGYYIRFLSGILLMISAIYIYRKGKPKRAPSKRTATVFIAIVSTALLVSVTLTGYIRPQTEIEGRFVYIDASHGERFNLIPYTRGSLTGLYRNLFRNNLLVFISRDFPYDSLSNANAFVVVSPTEKFNNEEIRALQELMQRGGLLLIGAGYSSRDVLLPILEMVGLDIMNLPLGSIPYGYSNESEPKFMDAYPVTYETKNVTIFYSIEKDNITYPVVVFARYGEGGCLLIGDGKYLTDKNIEFYYKYHIGNINFLRDIFEMLRLMGVDI